jgi:hypothetical protein
VEGIPVGVAPMMLLLADALPVVDVGCLSLHRPNLRPLSYLSFYSSPKFPHAPPEYLISCTTMHKQSATQAQSLLAFRILCLSLSLSRAPSLASSSQNRPKASPPRREGQREKKRKGHRYTIFMSARSPGPRLATHQCLF